MIIVEHLMYDGTSTISSENDKQKLISRLYVYTSKFISTKSPTSHTEGYEKLRHYTVLHFHIITEPRLSSSFAPCARWHC